MNFKSEKVSKHVKNNRIKGAFLQDQNGKPKSHIHSIRCSLKSSSSLLPTKESIGEKLTELLSKLVKRTKDEYNKNLRNQILYCTVLCCYSCHQILYKK